MGGRARTAPGGRAGAARAGAFEDPSTGIPFIDNNAGQFHYWRAAVGIVIR